jgi:LuxR family maltose regulon positive regulatory protein
LAARFRVITAHEGLMAVAEDDPRRRAMEAAGKAADRPRFHPPIPLVEAKLAPPAPRAGIIERVRLIRLLTAEPAASIVSIVAPPGYGKTLLLADWAAREPRPVAWLTLDDHDNDPAIFLSYLAAAFDRIEPIDGSIMSAIVAPRRRALSTAVPRLAFELHRWGRPALIVLDDVHRLVDRTCLEALAELLDHLPPGLRVALAARTEPGLPLGRIRAHGDLLEIGTSLLALDEAETDALTAAIGHKLTTGEVRELADRTEGWAAGVYLAVLARDHEDQGDAPMGDLSGRERYIAEYFRSELLPTLQGDDGMFLTRTAILERVEPQVAEEVTGLPGASERLRSLARANLFIEPTGGTQESYRYHHLLRDFLGAELERREPGTTNGLHRRASAWYAANGPIDLAIRHANAGGDVDGAARLITAATLPMYYSGRTATLDRWLEGFDEAVFERQPALAAMAAWVHILNGRADEADQMADIAERSTFVGRSDDGAASFASSRSMLRAIMGRRGPEDALANAAFAVSQEEPGSRWRGVALFLLGSAHMQRGDVGAADAAFRDSAAAAPAVGGASPIAVAKRSSIAIGRGDWRAAEAFARESRKILIDAHLDELVSAIVVYAVGARVAFHRGDVADGRQDLVRAQLVRPLASHAAPWYSVDALLELARAYLAASDVAGARSVLREAEEIVHRRPALGALVTELAEIRRQLGDAASTLAGSSSLTAAELRLLPILPTYLSFQEIADGLSVSRNTVKTQALSIYGKLQASSRGEAVERAVELGLLEPYPAAEAMRRTR